MRIGIDIDGVIIDFERTMNTYAEMYDLLILRKKGKINSSCNYPEKYDWNCEEIANFTKEYMPYATRNLTPFVPLAKEMLEILELEGIEYFFITSRGLINKNSKNEIINLFKKNNIRVDNIYFKVKDKVKLCKQLNIDIMIEDTPNICKNLSKNKIEVLYFRDKNSEIIKENNYLKEVSNTGEILRYIINKNKLRNTSCSYQKILLKKEKNLK